MSSSKKLLDRQGRSEEVFHPGQDGDFAIETREDVEPLIEVAKDLSDLQPSKEMRHAAIIPQFVLDQALREDWGKDDWRNWANNHDNQVFRTWKGKL